MRDDNKDPVVEWFYSFTAPGWFSPKYNPEVPVDAVQVSEQLRVDLLDGVCAGLVVVEGDSGLPELAEPPPPSVEQLAERERLWRDQQLLLSDPLVVRHRDEIEIGKPTTLEETLYVALQAYRAALRDWPESALFPDRDQRPVSPLAEL